MTGVGEGKYVSLTVQAPTVDSRMSMTGEDGLVTCGQCLI